MIALCAISFGTSSLAAAEKPTYTTQFLVALSPGEPAAEARIRVTQSGAHLKSLRFSMPEGEFSQVTGDGAITRQGNDVTWVVPARGGELRYRVVVNHQRNSKGNDGYVARNWALFRAEAVFPPAAAMLRAGAQGQGELLLALPAGWSAQTPYLPDADNRLRITPRGRSYERPVGWILAGQIGSRRDVIGPTIVRVAAPVGQAAQRVPALALLRWTLRVLAPEIPKAPPYLLIVMAGDPMWRGGLSAPNSIYLHADRPLISEDGTSTLIHELMHVLFPIPTAPDEDWMDEGLAEYLCIVVMLRSDAISQERYDHALDISRRRGAGVTTVLTRNSAGNVTARAVTIFSDLDKELQTRTNGTRDIFDLARRLLQEQRPVDMERLRELAAEMAGGKPLIALSAARVPGSR